MTLKVDNDPERRLLVAGLVDELQKVAHGHSIEDFHSAVANVVSQVALSQESPDAVILRMQALLLHVYGAQREMIANQQPASTVVN